LPSVPPIRLWQWANPAELTAMILPFKKKLYEDAVAAFGRWL
jgi:putative (di)nucleoside polyphosphate hydrolase